MKRVVSIVLIACIAFIVFPWATISAEAAIIPYSSLNISASSFDVVAGGKCSALKVNGVWCYKFTKNGKTLYIKASAFKNSKLNNSTNEVNKALTNNINAFKFNSTYKTTYLYKEKLSNSKDAYAGNCTVYRWKINKYHVSATSTAYDMTLKCEVKDGIYFTYNSKVKKNGKVISPSTAKDYMNALKRYHSTAYNSSKKPVFDVNITRPGTNKVYMSQYNMEGKGTWKVKEKAEWGDYIKVAYSIGNIAKSSVSSGLFGGLKSALGMAYQQSNPRYASGKYSTGREFYLSNPSKKKYCMKSKFESPVVVKKGGTYFKTKIFFSSPISTRSVKTVRSISFSLK